MGRLRKGKSGPLVSALIVSAIIILNIFGISYAYFTGALQLANSVSMGSMEVYFDGEPVFERVSGKDDLKVSLKGYNRILVEGTVTQEISDISGQNIEMQAEDVEIYPYEGTVKFDVSTGGSISAELVNTRITGDSSCIADGGLSSSNGSFSLPIKAEAGTYDFEIELFYEQGNP